MKGRQENELKTKELVDKLLQGQPQYLHEYYISLDNKSYTTQLKYLRYTIYLIEYLENQYNLDLKQIENFRQVKVNMINAYIVSLKYKEDGTEMSHGMKANRFYGAKNFFDFLVDNEYIENNPCDKVKLPKKNEQHEIISLTKEEIATIKHNIMCGVGNKLAITKQKKWRNRDMAIVMLSLSLGLRVTSVSEINMEDLDLRNNTIKIVEKGNKVRILEFSNGIKTILAKWIDDRKKFMEENNAECDALFITFQMKRMKSSAISEMLKKYTYNIDKHITPHKLRSTCATNVYEKTGDIYLVANILGHSSLSNTQRYTMVSKEKRKQAAQAMDDILF